MAGYRYEYPHPAVTVDAAIFTIRARQLQLLLIRRAANPHRGKWALPGGFIEIHESLDEAARRELEEETGLTGIHLEQFYTFGEPKRDPRERVITVAYYALVPAQGLRPCAATDAEEVGWFALGALPPLAFDHAEVIGVAYCRLLAALERSPFALQFVPGRFTLSELRSVHEIIRGEKLDSRKFRSRILALDQIEEVRDRSGPRRARLYQARRQRRARTVKSFSC